MLQLKYMYYLNLFNSTIKTNINIKHLLILSIIHNSNMYSYNGKYLQEAQQPCPQMNLKFGTRQQK